jgi:hypothetical protein
MVSVEVRLDQPVQDLLTGKVHDESLTLDPLGVAVVEEAVN